ncbi:MAG: phenylacetate--CoA ligase [Eubacteriales bacterium]|nr:phenylacetate--CoA ligase [Eubacteriales bacterium]
MIWNPKIEQMGRDEMTALQTARLRETVARQYRNVPFYKERFDAIGLAPEDIRSLDDLKLIPVTTKEDLRNNYPDKLFAVPRREIVRIHASTGTTGKPTPVGYTRADLDMWSECMARLISMAGVTADDTAQISFGYGLFTGALGLHYGLEKVGCSVIPISAGNTERQIMMMQDLGSTVLISTPSYALYIADTMERLGIGKDTIRLRVGLFGGEGSTEEMRAAIEDKLGILATENYGLSEVLGPGVSGECACKNGMHICEDNFIVEIVDPETMLPVPDGEWGEVVITPIHREGMSLLRYRTRDISRIMPGECPCGRTSRRMQKLRGRTDDMLIIRGVNVYPSQIEGVLIGMDGIGPHYELVVHNHRTLNSLEVRVEPTDETMLVDYGRLIEMQKRIRANLRTVLNIDADIKLVEPHSLKRFEGKARRVTFVNDED